MSALGPGCVKTPISKLLTQFYVKCEGDSLENEVRFVFEAHVLSIFGTNNGLEIVFTQSGSKTDHNPDYQTISNMNVYFLVCYFNTQYEIYHSPILNLAYILLKN